MKKGASRHHELYRDGGDLVHFWIATSAQAPPRNDDDEQTKPKSHK